MRRGPREEVDADGALVTPGFVDVHTHYDGQATWDALLSPSCWHGVTTVVMGNCGVGFAPVAPDKHDWLIGLMEGVEDIPGAALSEGIRWGWESFPQYLEAIDAHPHVIDIGAQVPHGAVRAGAPVPSTTVPPRMTRSCIGPLRVPDGQSDTDTSVSRREAAALRCGWGSRGRARG